MCSIRLHSYTSRISAHLFYVCIYLTSLNSHKYRFLLILLCSNTDSLSLSKSTSYANAIPLPLCVDIELQVQFRFQLTSIEDFILEHRLLYNFNQIESFLHVKFGGIFAACLICIEKKSIATRGCHSCILV